MVTNIIGWVILLSWSFVALCGIGNGAQKTDPYGVMMVAAFMICGAILVAKPEK